MIPALAALEQLEARLGESLDAAETERALAALDDASALVRDTADEDWLTDDDPPELADVPATVQTVTVTVAKRAFDNPEAFSQVNMAAGSAAGSFDRKNGPVFLTADEKRRVRKAAGLSPLGEITLVSPFGRGI